MWACSSALAGRAAGGRRKNTSRPSWLMAVRHAKSSAWQRFDAAVDEVRALGLDARHERVAQPLEIIGQAPDRAKIILPSCAEMCSRATLRLQDRTSDLVQHEEVQQITVIPRIEPVRIQLEPGAGSLEGERVLSVTE